MCLINEGLKELKLAVKQHRRDVLRTVGTGNSWKRETKKIFKPASIALGIAGLAASPAASLLIHGHLKPSTMAAVAAGSAAILPAFGAAKHLNDIVKIYRKRMRMKKEGKLMEAYHTTLPATGYNSEVDIYKNPTRYELHKLLQQSAFKSIRGLLSQENDGYHAYVWDAGNAPHFVAEDELKLDKPLKVNFFKHKDGNIHISQEYYRNESAIKSHPWVKKTLPNATIFFS